MIIAITGASGNLGRATLRWLLDSRIEPRDTVLVVREPSKAQDLALAGYRVLQGDYSDRASLDRCFSGVDRLLFISTSALGEERIRQHRNVVNAARAASVGHVIYTSVVKPSPAAVFSATPGHFQTEALIYEAGIPHTIFRNNLYMDLIPLLFGNAASSGTLLSCAGDGRAGFVSRDDIAHALSVALTTTGELRQHYSITASPSTYSLSDIAAALAKAHHKEIRYQSVSADELRQILLRAGVPGEAVELSVALGMAMRAGEFDQTSDDLRSLIDRAPTHIDDFLASADR